MHCAFRAPDETVLDGFMLSRDYQIDYPASRLTLAAGDTVEVAGNTYQGARRAPSATAPSVAPRSPNSEERPMNSVRERVLRRSSRAWHLRLPSIPVHACRAGHREASPALLLFVDGDSITAHANHLVVRLLIVRFAVVVRGADAFDVADQALVGPRGNARRP